MKIYQSNAATSIEFAIDNALERLSLLDGKDNLAVREEYREWLNYSNQGEQVLIIKDKETN